MPRVACTCLCPGDFPTGCVAARSPPLILCCAGALDLSCVRSLFSPAVTFGPPPRSPALPLLPSRELPPPCGAHTLWRRLCRHFVKAPAGPSPGVAWITAPRRVAPASPAVEPHRLSSAGWRVAHASWRSAQLWLARFPLEHAPGLEPFARRWPLPQSNRACFPSAVGPCAVVSARKAGKGGGRVRPGVPDRARSCHSQYFRNSLLCPKESFAWCFLAMQGPSFRWRPACQFVWHARQHAAAVAMSAAPLPLPSVLGQLGEGSVEPEYLAVNYPPLTTALAKLCEGYSRQGRRRPPLRWVAGGLHLCFSADNNFIRCAIFKRKRCSAKELGARGWLAWKIRSPRSASPATGTPGKTFRAVAASVARGAPRSGRQPARRGIVSLLSRSFRRRCESPLSAPRALHSFYSRQHQHEMRCDVVRLARLPPCWLLLLAATLPLRVHARDMPAVVGGAAAPRNR
jgi:hypothetical protein